MQINSVVLNSFVFISSLIYNSSRCSTKQIKNQEILLSSALHIPNIDWSVRSADVTILPFPTITVYTMQQHLINKFVRATERQQTGFYTIYYTQKIYEKLLLIFANLSARLNLLIVALIRLLGYIVCVVLWSIVSNAN